MANYEFLGVLVPTGIVVVAGIVHNTIKISRIQVDIKWIKNLLNLQFNNPGDQDK